jgi:MoaA/NifB/PqqE/SkfB family radical SAM enzyme
MRLPVIDPLPAATSPAPSPAFDTGPRSIAAVKVLRISVTDRCNFRCVYCMPEEGVRWLPKDDVLSFEEIRDVVRAAIDVHGIRRFKLTGGEPTVRHGIVDLVRMLRRVEGIEDLSLTTNGMLLEHLALPLRDSGLDRITISIDSLDREKFRKITRTGDLDTVMRGLNRCVDVGFDGTKINCVAMRGTNDDEFANFARLTLDRKLTVRFIEYMPLGDAALMHPRDSRLSLSSDEIGPAGGCGAQDRGANAFVAEPDIRARIESELGPLESIDRSTEPGVGPASRKSQGKNRLHLRHVRPLLLDLQPPAPHRQRRPALLPLRRRRSEPPRHPPQLDLIEPQRSHRECHDRMRPPQARRAFISRQRTNESHRRLTQICNRKS